MDECETGKEMVRIHVGQPIFPPETMTVGQKVVCIDDKFPPAIIPFYTAMPKEGKVYVIREVKIGVNLKGEPGEVCLYLIGLNNPKSSTPPFPERGFNSERFRPLEEMQQPRSETVTDAIGKDIEVQFPA